MSFTIVGRLPMIDSICEIMLVNLSRATTRYLCQYLFMPFTCVGGFNWRENLISWLQSSKSYTSGLLLLYLLCEFARANRSVASADHCDLVRLGKGGTHLSCHPRKNLRVEKVQIWILTGMGWDVYVYVRCLIGAQCGWGPRIGKFRILWGCFTATLSIMSTRAASSYSFQASAFFAICVETWVDVGTTILKIISHLLCLCLGLIFLKRKP